MYLCILWEWNSRVKNDFLLSFIISTKNKPWEVVSKTLDSIISSDCQDYEIILVDQNESQEINTRIPSKRKYQNITYLKSKETGLSKGRNLGINHSQGKWLLFFDDDAILSGDFFNKAAFTLVDNQEVPLVFYGRVLTLDTHDLYMKRSLLMGKKIRLLNFDAVSSIALIFNRKIFDNVGLFDENLGAGVEFGAGEESDIILRTLKKGYKIKLLNDFRVYHPTVNLVDLERRKSYGMGIGAIYKKHIFSSLYFFLILSTKLVAEIFLRAALVLSKFKSANLRRYHFYYLNGYIKGFFQYKTNKY